MALSVHALVIAGELEAAEDAAGAALSAAHDLGDALAYGYAGYHRALARLHRGALAGALSDLDVAGGTHAASWAAACGWNGWLIALTQLEVGDHDAARTALELAGDPPDDSMEGALVRHARARLDLAEGRPAAALEAATVAGGLLERHHGIDHPVLLPWRTTAALAARQLGMSERARELADDAITRARAVNVAQAVGSALRVAGVVAGRGGDVELLTEAVGILRSTPAVPEYARALVDLGTALHHAGRAEAASRPLRLGLALAERVQAGPLVEHARAAVHALGLRPRRTAVTGAAALTPCEHRVCALAVNGRSNREIAQALFITVKTVESHLTHVYQKLVISGRRQLAQALGPERDGAQASPHDG
jgi:DNA-binding CsgD family transcriptional regulator